MILCHIFLQFYLQKYRKLVVLYFSKYKNIENTNFVFSKIQKHRKYQFCIFQNTKFILLIFY